MADLSVWQPGKDPDVPVFPLVFWGYQRKAVDRYLKDLAKAPAGTSEIIELHATPAQPTDRLGRYRELGVEIGELLTAVEETVVRIREAAEIDAAEWRKEASGEAQERVTAAQSAAEDLRAAAWEASTQMIAQMKEREQQAHRSIEKHSQGVIAEAENEAHRVRGEARRRADAIRRHAQVEALESEERTRALCDQMINSAEQKVSAIQERVLALERHRDQLLEEIGGIRAGVAPVGVKLVDQTGGLVYPSPEERDEPDHVTPHHEMSGLVRVIAPTEDAEDAEDTEAQPTEPKVAEKAPISTAQPTGKEPDSTDDSGSPFEDLFSSLRQAATTPTESVGPRPAKNAGKPLSMDGDRAIELQEEMLLPITGQFLREFKRLLTEEQNRVLEGLRTGHLKWEVEEVNGRLRSHLEMLTDQSRQAGHRAAEQLSGESLPLPDMAPDTEPGFAAQLVAEVTAAIGAEGSLETAQRNRLASRTFRVWRNEKLDQHLREVSERHYQQGLAGSLNTAGAAQS